LTRLPDGTNFSPRTGDMAHVTETAESYFYAEGEWKRSFRSGDAGMIDVGAVSVTLEDGGSLSTSNAGQGDGGIITFEAEKVEMNSGASVSSASKSEGTGGNAGTITVTADAAVMVSGNSFLETSAAGSGNGGNIKIASGSVHFSGNEDDPGRSGIFTDATEKDAGDVEIDAAEVSFTNGSMILSETRGEGNTGNILIKAEKDISFTENAGIGSESLSENEDVRSGDITLVSSGNIEFSGGYVYSHAPNREAGTVCIRAENISFEDGAVIRTDTFGKGRGGDINISATDEAGGQPCDSDVGASGRVHIFGGKICSKSEDVREGAGDAGNISITANRILLEGGGEISASTEGPGSAGGITLCADNLELGTGASVSSASNSESGGGDAGTITIIAGDSIELRGSGTLTTDARGAGGGKISVEASNSIYLLNSEITSSVRRGGGDGGDITADSKFVILNRSPVEANAEDGDGGAIFIRTDNYIKSSDSSVTATSERGNDGTVRIEAPNVDIGGVLVILPGTFLDAARWMKKPCSARTGERTSSFVIRGRDAVPTALDDLRASPFMGPEN